ncbi:MAG: GtrA family protein [Bergeyella zoohelcum]|nr:GtrA family protein [Bergeyella zoohelcum]
MKALLLKQKQILFFIIAGAMSAVIEVGSFKILSITLPKILSWENYLYGLRFPMSNVLSTSCGIISNYFFSIWFVFQRGKHSRRREFAYFVGVSGFSTLLSLLFFQVFYVDIYLDDYFDFGFFVLSAEMLSKISAIVLVSILSYIVKKKLVFSN